MKKSGFRLWCTVYPSVVEKDAVILGSRRRSALGPTQGPPPLGSRALRGGRGAGRRRPSRVRRSCGNSLLTQRMECGRALLRLSSPPRQGQTYSGSNVRVSSRVTLFYVIPKRQKSFRFRTEGTYILSSLNLIP